MIRLLKTGTMGVIFGMGSTRILSKLAPNGQGRVELNECVIHPVGTETVGRSMILPNSRKIILQFKSVEGLDVLLNQLNSLRDQMTEGTGA